MNEILDIIIDPASALKTARGKSPWIFPLFLSTVLLLISYFLSRSAELHASFGSLREMLNSNSMFANYSESAKQKILDEAMHPSLISQIFSILTIASFPTIATIVNASLLYFGSLLWSGDAPFKSLFRASALTSIPTTGLVAIMNALVLSFRGANSFTTLHDVYLAIPNLAWFIPAQNSVEFYFLAGIGVGSVWAFILNTIAMRITARTPLIVSWMPSLIAVLLAAGLSAMQGLVSN